MALTHFDLKNAKPDAKPYKLFDDGYQSARNIDPGSASNVDPLVVGH